MFFKKINCLWSTILNIQFYRYKRKNDKLSIKQTKKWTQLHFNFLFFNHKYKFLILVVSSIQSRSNLSRYFVYIYFFLSNYPWNCNLFAYALIDYWFVCFILINRWIGRYTLYIYLWCIIDILQQHS